MLCCSTSFLAAAQQSLLGYAIRRTAADEMLYGGVRVSCLSPKPFPLQYIKSEELPSPSLRRERHDLGLEMQLPRDLEGYNQLDMSIQRQVGSNEDDSDDAVSRGGEEGFDMGEYFSTVFHPERHHNSSLPYSAHDTNNVLGLRMFPLNMGIRLRVEGVRIRTADCLERLRDAKRCAQQGRALQYPLPYYKRAEMAERRGEGPSSTLSTSAGPSDVKDEAAMDSSEAKRSFQVRAHLRGGPSHPPPAELSIFTRPQDHPHGDGGGGSTSIREEALAYFRERRQGGRLISPDGVRSTTPDRRWTPLQMLKPIPHTWSPAIRSSGTRGPSMQLMQERLDRKGFGWKRKSRSLWQQDPDTAGFRPHRYF
ncbi:unnamed protein product [Phytomonas sp. EM1]|nr:unnamed protein product [Phytomonas sp. EM1]|eukprot:CCW64712.1 unnamed protein product [Phytomonas sp. isolate EM1]